MTESIFYFLFKQRLKSKLKSLYEVEDPWSSAFLAEVFAPWIRSQMLQLPPQILSAPVLDAGGGEGYFGLALREQINEYHLLDIEEQALRRARIRLQGMRVSTICKSLDEFRPQPESYGVIWLFSVLNYLGSKKYPQTFERTIRSLWASLQPEGIIILIHPLDTQDFTKKIDLYRESFIALGGLCTFFEDRQVSRQVFQISIIKKSAAH